MRRAWVLLMATGCRQLFGLDDPGHRDPIDASELDSSDAPMDDSATDSGPLSCIQRWQAGPEFSAPAPVSIAATGANDADPYTTDNELTFYWSQNQQIRISTRAARTDAFLTSAMSPLDSGNPDGKVTIDGTGNIGYQSSARAGGAGGGGADIWHFARTSASDPWVIDQLYVAALNTTANEYDPHMSSDALRMYLAPADTGVQAIKLATRTAVGANWNAPNAIPELDIAGATEGDPSLTGNELVIVFSVFGTSRDLYYATRANAQSAFGTPKPLTAFNASNTNEGGPHVTSDGCELYYETSAGGNLDVYMAAVIGP